MSKEEAESIIQSIKEHTELVCRSPEAALDSLVKAGIVNKDGTLTEAYAPCSQD